MKTLWNVISFLAVVNGLSLILFIGWLIQSDRLNLDRVYEIREMLVTTIAAEAAEAEAAGADEVRSIAATLESMRADNPFPPAIEQISYVHRLNQGEADRARRSETDAQHLRDQLAIMQAQLLRERAEFEQERAAWDAQRKEIAARENDAQFQQVVKLLESIPAKQAKGVLAELVQIGKLETAVSYLNAMKPYNAAKVLREFKSDEERTLATQLLERMKTLAEPAEVAGTLNANADGQSG